MLIPVLQLISQFVQLQMATSDGSEGIRTIAYRLSPIILGTPGTAFMPGGRAKEHRDRQYQLATCELSSTVAKEI
jgi:hypothetical protein